MNAAQRALLTPQPSGPAPGSATVGQVQAFCGPRPQCSLGHWGPDHWGPDHGGSTPWWDPGHWESRPLGVQTTGGPAHGGVQLPGVQAMVGSSKSPFRRWRSSSLSPDSNPLHIKLGPGANRRATSSANKSP